MNKAKQLNRFHAALQLLVAGVVCLVASIRLAAQDESAPITAPEGEPAAIASDSPAAPAAPVVPAANGKAKASLLKSTIKYSPPCLNVIPLDEKILDVLVIRSNVTRGFVKKLTICSSGSEKILFWSLL